MTNPKTEPRPAAGTRVIRRVPLGLVTAGDPSQQPGPRNGVNGPHPPRPAGGVAPEGCPLGGAWRSQAPTVNGPKSVVQTRSWPRGGASAGHRRSRCPALTGPRAGPATGDALEPVNLPPHSPVNSPRTRDRGRVRGRLGGRMRETRPLIRGENQDGPEKISSEVAPAWRSARRTCFDGMNHAVSLGNCVVLRGQSEGARTEHEARVHVA